MRIEEGIEHGAWSIEFQHAADSGQLAVEFWCKVQGIGRSKEQERHDDLYPEPCTHYPNYSLLDYLIAD